MESLTILDSLRIAGINIQLNKFGKKKERQKREWEGEKRDQRYTNRFLYKLVERCLHVCHKNKSHQHWPSGRGGVFFVVAAVRSADILKIKASARLAGGSWRDEEREKEGERGKRATARGAFRVITPTKNTLQIIDHHQATWETGPDRENELERGREKAYERFVRAREKYGNCDYDS